MLKEDGRLMVTMADMYEDGDWGQMDKCKTGSYGAGIQLQVRFCNQTYHTNHFT